MNKNRKHGAYLRIRGSNGYKNNDMIDNIGYNININRNRNNFSNKITNNIHDHDRYKQYYDDDRFCALCDVSVPEFENWWTTHIRGYQHRSNHFNRLNCLRLEKELNTIENRHTKKLEKELETYLEAMNNEVNKVILDNNKNNNDSINNSPSSSVKVSEQVSKEVSQQQQLEESLNNKHKNNNNNIIYLPYFGLTDFKKLQVSHAIDFRYAILRVCDLDFTFLVSHFDFFFCLFVCFDGCF